MTSSFASFMDEFVAHFGEMGSHWGINRTVGQIYALLYISPDPLNADQIGEHLHISRSNVSMSLKELSSWGITRTKHIPGDRKEYFTVLDDIWDIIRALIAERKKRELDPTISLLRNLLLVHSETSGKDEQAMLRRVENMHEVLELLTEWYDDMQKLETKNLIRLLKLGNSIAKFTEKAEKLNVFKKGNPESDHGET